MFLTMTDSKGRSVSVNMNHVTKIVPTEGATGCDLFLADGPMYVAETFEWITTRVRHMRQALEPLLAP